MALELTSPTTIEADAPPMNNETWAPRSKVAYQFPGTTRTVGETITVTWYDGEGHKPAREGLGLPENYELPHAGSVLVGEKGTMVLPHWSMPRLFPEEKFADYQVCRSWMTSITTRVGARLPWRRQDDVELRLRRAADRGGAAWASIAIRFPKEQLQWDSEAAAVHAPCGCQWAADEGISEGLGVADGVKIDPTSPAN